MRFVLFICLNIDYIDYVPGLNYGFLLAEVGEASQSLSYNYPRLISVIYLEIMNQANAPVPDFYMSHILMIELSILSFRILIDNSFTKHYHILILFSTLPDFHFQLSNIIYDIFIINVP